MLWFVFLVLLVLWMLGLAGTYQIGAWLWLLLVAAVIVLIVQLATGRRVAPLTLVTEPIPAALH